MNLIQKFLALLGGVLSYLFTWATAAFKLVEKALRGLLPLKAPLLKTVKSTFDKISAAANGALSWGKKLAASEKVREHIPSNIPPPRQWSLRLRLSVFFAALLLTVWAIAAFWAWKESREYIDAFFDTQQMLFAKRLASTDFGNLTGHLPDTNDILPHKSKASRGEQEDDALGFAIFSPDGRLLLSDGENGKNFIFDPAVRGFADRKIRDSDEKWRTVWIASLDGRFIVAVGQEIDYREDMSEEMLLGQMLPWLLLLPALLFGLAWMLHRELAPLRSVTKQLESRPPSDVTPIETDVPSEVKPLVEALNSLFVRINSMLQRERAFIANAAHELRTPLAGLSIQAQVASLAADKPEARTHALNQLMSGINRANRLVDQLLILFQLEALQDVREQGASTLSPPKELKWAALLQSSISEMEGLIKEKDISLTQNVPEESPVIIGQNELLLVLLRNLLGNAVKYTPNGGSIGIQLNGNTLSIINDAQTIPEDYVSRLGERFFRPPGQIEAGSGLGLSIAKRVVQMHGLQLSVHAEKEKFITKILF